MPDDEVQRVSQGAYSELSKLKAKYDPDNLFRMIQNIRRVLQSSLFGTPLG